MVKMEGNKTDCIRVNLKKRQSNLFQVYVNCISDSVLKFVILADHLCLL